MIVDIETTKESSPIDTELFLGGREVNISPVFISQYYFKVPKTIKLNATHYFIMKIPNKREFQQIESNNLSDNEFKDFMKLFTDYAEEPFSFLVKYISLASDNLLRFMKNLIQNDCQ